VKTTLPLPSTDSADLTVYVDAVNPTNAPATTTITETNATADLAGKQPHLLLRGYNVPSSTTPVP
jgi:hypothetical protein